METTSASEFGWLARQLAIAARNSGMRAPGFRSPPRAAGRNRTVKVFADGAAIVAVRTKGRERSEVIDDMIEGIIVANGISGNLAVMARRTLLRSLAAHNASHAA